MTTFFAEYAYLPDGWAKDMAIRVVDSHITDISHSQYRPGMTQLDGAVTPMLANVHSHAFQRAMAGLSEIHTQPNDSFWSWRKQMYSLVNTLDPEQVYQIARSLFQTMLGKGYSHVGEFHYVFHQPDGTPYAPLDEMAGQILNAADEVGMGVTMLPALYAFSGFADQPATQQQQRFVNSVDQYLTHHQLLKKRIETSPRHKLGVCFHSLRAVNKTLMQEVLDATGRQVPIHIHIAEQQKEVDDCAEAYGQRPVEWLFENFPVDKHWTLIHATHLSAAEIELIANSGAVVGLCPTTEANLGDGIFPAVQFTELGGRWAIGSDSHVSVCPAEELRLLEYSQRLRDQRRNRLYSPETPNVGEYLFRQALSGGNQACGVQLGLQAGNRADFMVLAQANTEIEQLFNQWIFAPTDGQIQQSYCGGKR